MTNGSNCYNSSEKEKKENIVAYTMKNRIHISKCKKEIHIDLNLSHDHKCMHCKLIRLMFMSD